MKELEMLRCKYLEAIVCHEREIKRLQEKLKVAQEVDRDLGNLPPQSEQNEPSVREMSEVETP